MRTAFLLSLLACHLILRPPLAAAEVYEQLRTPRQRADPSLVEKYFHAGELARGEQELLLVLDTTPGDDRARFGLGVLQFFRAVERLGQSLHEYGADTTRSNTPFLRLPVPKNPAPSTISYRAFGRILDLFAADLERAERTLAGVEDDKVRLPLRLAEVRLDLTGSGLATEKLADIVARMSRGNRDFLDGNPDFLVCFDRGDVAWLRAYCHLLCAGVELYRALDLEEYFVRVGSVFPKVEPGRKRWKEGDEVELRIADGPRLGRFRRHLLAVCELNRETWKYVRAETDDDHEWLPNSRQKGVLGMRVTDGMIDGWLEMIGKVEGLMKGELLWPNRTTDKGVEGLDFKALLDDPPAELSERTGREEEVARKYTRIVGKNETFDWMILLRVWGMFDNPLGYMAWFN